ncbi:MAG: thermonuclease family protein, partial [Patescibacteria group bacterium]|nr:thermonuclease family protein [Patescibacteria group bacterium]
TQKQSQLTTHGTVTRIIDADSLELDNKQSVRLYAVGCPEKGQKFSAETIAYLTKTALNQKVTLDYQPNYTKDSFGRTLAYVFIGDTHLNEQLIRQGFCEVTIYQKRAKLKYQDELLEAQTQAKQIN